MANQTSKLLDRVTTLLSTKFIFYGLILLLLMIAVGHLYVLDGRSELHLGLPLWLWVQVVVIFVMLGIAWIAVRMVAVATGGSE